MTGFLHTKGNSAKIYELEINECDANTYWRVRLCKSALTKIHEVEIKFYKRDGSRGKVRFPAADRAAPKKIISLLHAHNARLPENCSDALRFVQDLVRAIPNTPIISTFCPGWVDRGRGFVMPSRRYGTATNVFVWDADASPARFGSMAGSLIDYQRSVLIPARQSTYLTTAVMIALASPLPGYVEQRLGRKLVSETALFHWAGDTSGGKSTLARVTQSVIGAPDELCDYRASERGAAEESYRRNDLVAIFDEAEHNDDSDQVILQQMKKLSQCVTSGRSRRVSRVVQATLPDLKWTCFGISTGPLTQAELAHRLGKRRYGQSARFIDIRVPSPDVGGIFDKMIGCDGRVPTSASSAERIEAVEGGIALNHGVLLDGWIEYLLANDGADRIIALNDQFRIELAGEQEAHSTMASATSRASSAPAPSTPLCWPRTQISHAAVANIGNAISLRNTSIQAPGRGSIRATAGTRLAAR